MTHTKPGIWVCTELNPDGSSGYTVTVTATDDIALSLQADTAVRYVAAVNRAAVIAQHDAAVLHQLVTRLELDDRLAAMTIVDMRKSRTPVQDDATAPLTFEPIVSASTRRPYVHVLGGPQKKPITQWTPADCFQKARCWRGGTTRRGITVASVGRRPSPVPGQSQGEWGRPVPPHGRAYDTTTAAGHIHSRTATNPEVVR